MHNSYAMRNYSEERFHTDLARLRKELRREPTVLDIDQCEYMPSARTIQRRLGGVVKLRNRDLRTGKDRADTLMAVRERWEESTSHFDSLLKEKFEEKDIHYERPITVGGLKRTDYYIWGFGSIDIFYPSQFHGLRGCVQHKLKKYKGLKDSRFPIYFVCLNAEFSQETINKMIANKKQKVPKFIHVLTLAEFQKILNSF